MKCLHNTESIIYKTDAIPFDADYLSKVKRKLKGNFQFGLGFNLNRLRQHVTRTYRYFTDTRVPIRHANGIDVNEKHIRELNT